MVSNDFLVKDYPPNLDRLLDSIIESDKGKVAFRERQKGILVTNVWRIKSWMSGSGSLAKSRLLCRESLIHFEKEDKKKNKHFVIKYDYSYKRDKLIREISWLLNLDKSVSYLFPKIVYYSLNKK